MILLDRAHVGPIDLKGDIKTLVTKANISAATIPESAFQIDAINADGVVGAEGSLFRVLSLDKIQSLKGRPAISLLYAPLSFNRAIQPGQSKALRVWCSGPEGLAANAFVLRKFINANNRPQLMWGDTVDAIGWQWMYFKYESNGRLRWWASAGQAGYDGYPGAPVTFDCVTRAVNHQFELDVGRSGSAPPVGYEWV